MIAPVSKADFQAFSLVEVAIALGVAGTGLLVVLSLLPGLLRQPSEARQSQVALGLADAITIELRSLTGPNLNGLSARAGDFSAASSALRLVAAADGSDLREFSEGDDREKFFLIELHRFPPGSALDFAPRSAWIALQARVSWPFRPAVDAASEVPPEARQRVTFNIAVNQ
jgi:hypothetical protein